MAKGKLIKGVIPMRKYLSIRLILLLMLLFSGLAIVTAQTDLPFAVNGSPSHGVSMPDGVSQTWQCNQMPESMQNEIDQHLRRYENSQAVMEVSLVLDPHQFNNVSPNDINGDGTCLEKFTTIWLLEGTTIEDIVIRTGDPRHTVVSWSYLDEYAFTVDGRVQLSTIEFNEKAPARFSVVVGSEKPGYRYGVLALDTYTNYYAPFVPVPVDQQAIIDQLSYHGCYLIAYDVQEHGFNEEDGVDLYFPNNVKCSNPLIPINLGMPAVASLSYGSAISGIHSDENGVFNFYSIHLDVIPEDGKVTVNINPSTGMNFIVANDAVLTHLIRNMYHDLGEVTEGCSDQNFQFGMRDDGSSGQVVVWYNGNKVGELFNENPLRFEYLPEDFESTIPYNMYANPILGDRLVSTDAANGAEVPTEWLINRYNLYPESTICPHLELP